MVKPDIVFCYHDFLLFLQELMQKEPITSLSKLRFTAILYGFFF